jgi:type II secretory pathway predicted ATPase ExeA
MATSLRDEEWRLVRLERLGLKEDPFTLSADPRYLYLGPEHFAVYRQVQGVIARRRGLALVSGDMGMGKSSLARRLYDVYAPDENVSIHYIHTAAFKSAMDAARQISTAMGLAAQRSLQRQMEALELAMVESYRAGHNVVLLLDDAQLMVRDALEVIHRLYNFDYDAKVIQILAFGQQELTDLFQTDKAVNARVFVRMVLPPLALPSALQMILFRLQVAGRSEPMIADDAFELLYEESRGVPREIVRLCAMATDRLLQTDEHIINTEIATEVTELHEL